MQNLINNIINYKESDWGCSVVQLISYSMIINYINYMCSGITQSVKYQVTTLGLIHYEMIFIDFHCRLHKAQSREFLFNIKETIAPPKISEEFAS